MKTQESFTYVVGVDVSKAKLDIALRNESLTRSRRTRRTLHGAHQLSWWFTKMN